MRKFSISVNGTAYEVEVEEIGGTPTVAAPAASAAAPAAPKTEAPKAAAPAAAVAKPAGPAGALKIQAPMPGTILDVRVQPGAAVKKGTVLLILEAMKMENEIVAPQDGTVATINVSKGQQVNSGDLMISLG